jgi:hypothetical protein
VQRAVVSKAVSELMARAAFFFATLPFASINSSAPSPALVTGTFVLYLFRDVLKFGELVTEKTHT